MLPPFAALPQFWPEPFIRDCHVRRLVHSAIPAPPFPPQSLTWALLALFLLPVFGALGALAYQGGPTHWSQWDRTVDQPARRRGRRTRRRASW